MKHISILTQPLVEDYVYSLYRQKNPLLTELRELAERTLVPVITRDMERLIYTLCAIKKPKRILEIGTAIGYSAICYAEAAPEAEITTIEVRERSVYKARKNIERAGYSDRINVIFGKAEEVLPEMEGIFDIIFIDAAKGQYHRFFDLCEKNMAKDTLIISDNVLYKGMPCDDSFIDERRNKTISRRMKEYLEFLSTDPRFETSLLAIGDGAALSYYK
ncbi:MAG: O-methyltransferase [Bacillota bacterium]|nr:O-methyltransferase [Bacillota bacterium]